MQEQSIRWKQRFQSFCRALEILEDAASLSQKRELSDLEKQGVIQAFEFIEELSWKTLSDYMKYEGIEQNIAGSKDAVRHAFSAGLIDDGDLWMEMIEARNRSSHTYDRASADEIAARAVGPYRAAFSSLKAKLEQKL